VTQIDVPFLAFERSLCQLRPDQTSIEVVQSLPARDRPASSPSHHQRRRCHCQKGVAGDDRMTSPAASKATRPQTSVSRWPSPNLTARQMFIHYDVRRILEDPSLEHLSSIDYLAVRLEPNHHLASAIAWGTEAWLNGTPTTSLSIGRPIGSTRWMHSALS